jgi:MFS family permease
MILAKSSGVDNYSAVEDRSRKLTAKDWWVMAALMVGIMMSPLNVMFTIVALPTMKDHFALNVEQATWIATAYFIPAVALMPFQSQLGQRIGMRKVYVAGLVILAAGAIFAALAPSFQWLLASRLVQGLGWSALYPLALILINKQYPRGRQGEMMGIWESSVGLTTIIAPVVGGFLVYYLGWRSLFGTMGLIAAAGAILAWLVIPSSRQPHTRPTSDWLSVIGLTFAIVLTLIGLSARNPIILIVALLAWLGWAILSNRIDQPAIPPWIFKNVRFITASLAANIRMLVAIAALIALPLFFEEVQGLTPAMVGSLMVIYSLFLFLGSWPGGRWSDRAGAAIPGSVGYMAMLAGILLLLGLDSTFVIWIVAIALAVRGVGAGLSQAPYAKAATEAVPPDETQTAAGLYGTIRYSGLALGTALVGIFLQSRLGSYNALDGGSAAVPAFRELWLLLALILGLGFALTLIMSRTRPASSFTEVVSSGSN